jgi:hypothetical protein
VRLFIHNEIHRIHPGLAIALGSSEEEELMMS